MAGFTFAGKLETTSFPEISGAVYRLGKSGELKVSTGKRSRTIWFLDGNPVAVTSDDPRDHLARVLEESGKISAEDAHRLETVPEEKDVLQGIDFVPRDLLTWGLKSRFVQLCYDTFRWTEGEYRFQESAPPRNLPLLKVPTPTMILKGVAYLPPVYLRRRVPAKGTIEPGAVSPEDAVYLSVEEKVFLETCREGGEAGEIAAAAKDPDEAKRRIFSFIALGLLSLRVPIHEAAEEEMAEPPIMELTEEAIIQPSAPEPRPQPPAVPSAAPARAPRDDDAFDDEPVLPAAKVPAQPLQGELPYEGRGVTIPPPAKRRSIFLPLQKRGLWLVIGGFGVVLVVALWRIFSLITTPTPTATVPLTRVFPTPRPTTVVVAAASPAAPTGSPVEGSAAATAVPAMPTAVPATPTAVPAKPTVAPTTRPAATPVPTVARAAVKPSAVPAPMASAATVDRYREGLDVYRAGQVRKAAEVWESLLAGTGGYTIQIEIACSAETIAKDFPVLEKLGEPFLLPHSLKGRPCYLVCVGRYPAKAEADRALAALPAPWAKEGANVRSIKALTGR